MCFQKVQLAQTYNKLHLKKKDLHVHHIQLCCLKIIKQKQLETFTLLPSPPVSLLQCLTRLSPTACVIMSMGDKSSHPEWHINFPLLIQLRPCLLAA